MVAPVWFEKFDLNLLFMLDTLLREQNVSRTASAMNLTQPAVSTALGKLRRHFDDPLLVRVGSHYTLSPLASELQGPVAQALLYMRGVIRARVQFDPLTSRAKVVIASSDWFATTHLSRLLQKLTSAAPLIQIEHRSISPIACDAMVNGTLDLLVLREERLLRDHPSELLATAHVGVIGCASQAPFQAASVTLADIAPFAQILALSPNGQPAMPHVHPYLAQETIIAMTSSASLLPEMVINTPYVAVIPLHAARHYARFFPIRYATITDPIPGRIFVQWQRQRFNDPLLVWVRLQLTTIQAAMDQ